MKGLIEKEKREKIRNDREFEEKEKALENERRKLRMIENQMRKTSNPNYTLLPENSLNYANRQDQQQGISNISAQPRKQQ